MFTLIISTAQQARPNVIHQSEPVRAHWNNSSVDVTRKPLSVTSAERSSKKARSGCVPSGGKGPRSEEHTSELQSLMRISYAVFCLKKKTKSNEKQPIMTPQTR